MKSRLYAQALKEVLEKAPQEKVKGIALRLKFLLKKRGDLRHLPSVLKEFEEFWTERKGKLARVALAKSQSAELKAKLVSKLRKIGFQYKEEIQSELIGGLAIFLGKEYLIDNTVRSKLAKLHG
ncbi:MAG: F0F1 ATP synthase subunit delta [bacterium]|nr:F0F1 ATP synthase subunit delta [Candidatus Wildermuthbacteria bacterium]MDP2664428.1 F0F1 ATP synthase subunit delta [bacterium]